MVGAACGLSPEPQDQYRFGHGVPEAEREPIRHGVEAMKAWLESEGNVHLQRMTVEVDTDLNSLVSQLAHYNQVEDPIAAAQWLVSGGALTTGSVVYIYVGPEWEGYAAWQKSLIAAHEVFHVAQYGFLWDDLAFTDRSAPNQPPNWLTEGGADYAAARALERAGIYSYDDLRSEKVAQAAAYPASLASIGAPAGDIATGDAAPYAVGFLAMEQLASEHGEGAAFEFWDALGESVLWQRSFADAFGLDPDAFVAGFDGARAGASPKGGVSGTLVRKNGAGVNGATIVVCPTDEGWCRTTWTSDTGSFSLSLEPGTYEIQYRVANRSGVERGHFELDASTTISVSDAIVGGLHAIVREPL
jgi:hypothetical protein